MKLPEMKLSPASRASPITKWEFHPELFHCQGSIPTRPLLSDHNRHGHHIETRDMDSPARRSTWTFLILTPFSSAYTRTALRISDAVDAQRCDEMHHTADGEPLKPPFGPRTVRHAAHASWGDTPLLHRGTSMSQGVDFFFSGAMNLAMAFPDVQDSENSTNSVHSVHGRTLARLSHGDGRADRGQRLALVRVLFLGSG